MTLRRTTRKAPVRPGTKSNDEETWPYTDPGTRWEVQPSHMPVDWSGVMVDHYEPEVLWTLLGPDGEPISQETTERTFGFARWLEEEEE